jgi:hypothetical protein
MRISEKSPGYSISSAHVAVYLIADTCVMRIARSSEIAGRQATLDGGMNGGNETGKAFHTLGNVLAA